MYLLIKNINVVNVIIVYLNIVNGLYNVIVFENLWQNFVLFFLSFWDNLLYVLDLLESFTVSFSLNRHCRFSIVNIVDLIYLRI